MNVFNDGVQRQRLPKQAYDRLRKTMEAGEDLEPGIADAVAGAMKDWAVERGATHYTHWFQPMTGLTAEKHDSFISIAGDGRVINDFSGKELIQGEPDASSFPSGGIRATFEARGYTAWDPTSPAFLREGPGGLTLCIPTAFCSWTGEALDKKTPLLRSDEAISSAAVKLINLLGNDKVTRVYSTAGSEQEYFLVDRELANMRPDLVACDRTVMGAAAPKGQQLDDHYFGAISQRALLFMQDLETELWKLGIPVKTRHNEVAPMQFELAPIYQKITIMADQSMLIMEMLKVVAEWHGFKCLLHEKPFAGINGSGKHTNWSLADNQGNNILAPGNTPHDNLQFMLFLTGIIRAVDMHGDVMRYSIASAGNDHRLGANEAPPAIISAFLGTQLEDIVNSIVDKTPQTSNGEQEEIRLGVNTLPPLPRDMTDRNRTSPFAFTGDKFEFRAVGSAQSISDPSTVLNTIVAESLCFLTEEIESRNSDGDLNKTADEVVAETLEKHRRIIFGGDNYSAEWTEEAERRGLPNLRDTPTAIEQMTCEKTLALFEKYGVLSRRESESRQNVAYDNYAIALDIEAETTLQMAQSQILPAALTFIGQASDSINSVTTACPDADVAPQQNSLKEVVGHANDLKNRIDALRNDLGTVRDMETSEADLALAYRDRIIPGMTAIRESCDALELMVDDDIWPIPKYRELLSIH